MDANRLRAAAMLKGLNQGELAALISVSPATLSGRMSGKSSFSLDEVRMLAKKLQLTGDEIMEIFELKEM